MRARMPAHKQRDVRDRRDLHPNDDRHRAALVVVFTNLLRHLVATCYAHRRTVNFCPGGIARSVDDSIRIVPLLLTLREKEKRRVVRSSPRRHVRLRVVVARKRHVAIW